LHRTSAGSGLLIGIVRQMRNQNLRLSEFRITLDGDAQIVQRVRAAKRLEINHRALELFARRGRRCRNGQCAAVGRRLGVMRLRVAGKSSSAEHEQAGSPAQGTTSEMLDFRNYKDERSMRLEGRKRYASY
jgi:hypothetical protein